MSYSPSSPGRSLARLLVLPLLFALCSALLVVMPNVYMLAYFGWEKVYLRAIFYNYRAIPHHLLTVMNYLKPQKDQKADQEEEDLDELFGEDDEPSTQSDNLNDEDNELEDLFGEEEDVNKQQKQLAEAQRKAKEACEADQIAFVEINKRITPAVKIFRSIEGGISAFIARVVEHFKHFWLSYSF